MTSTVQFMDWIVPAFSCEVAVASRVSPVPSNQTQEK
jgi:hypothetical protein